MAMNDMDFHGPTDGAACWTLPPEFVRLRYFFGQRLGVVDLTDEQNYVVGKHLFHNLRAHGTGVLCGLRAERFVYPSGGTATTVLKIRRGAAIDAFGRDVVVGWDQCIDVASWFRKNAQTNPDLAEWLEPEFPAEDRRLWVCLRYRECPSDPAPAPRDPCGCDAGGCEFGRVREGFELSLLTRSEVDRFTKQPLPAASGLRPEETLGSMDAAVGTALARALAGDCPEPADGCLCLASFTVAFDVTQQLVTDLGVPDNTLAERLSLASTALLQQMVLQLTAAAAQDGSLGAGPRLDALSFEGTAADAGTISISVNLASDGAVKSPLIPDAEKQLRIACSFFTDEGVWKPLNPGDAEILYESSPSPRFLIKWSTGLQDGRYRLTVAALDPDAPLVDMRMRPLLPRQYVRHFRLLTDSGSGALALAGALYDP